MGIKWKYSARAMRVIWLGNGLLFVGIVFLYFTPVVTMVLAPIATGITLTGSRWTAATNERGPTSPDRNPEQQNELGR